MLFWCNFPYFRARPAITQLDHELGRGSVLSGTASIHTAHSSLQISYTSPVNSRYSAGVQDVLSALAVLAATIKLLCQRPDRNPESGSFRIQLLVHPVCFVSLLLC